MADTQQSLAYGDFKILLCPALGWGRFLPRPKSALWATSEVALGCALRHSFHRHLLPAGGSNYASSIVTGLVGCFPL